MAHRSERDRDRDRDRGRLFDHPHPHHDRSRGGQRDERERHRSSERQHHPRERDPRDRDHGGGRSERHSREPPRDPPGRGSAHERGAREGGRPQGFTALGDQLWVNHPAPSPREHGRDSPRDYYRASSSSSSRGGRERDGGGERRHREDHHPDRRGGDDRRPSASPPRGAAHFSHHRPSSPSRPPPPKSAPPPPRSSSAAEPLPPPPPPPPPPEAERPYDPTLDFLSDQFDAEKALKTDWLLPPRANVLPLDNINKCRAILPRECEDALVNQSMVPQTTEEKRAVHMHHKARALAQEAKVEALAQGPKILDEIAEKHSTGPLSVLHAAYKAQRRVRVVTRHAHGVRGHCTGLLVAYDKYMNMCLKFTRSPAWGEIANQGHHTVRSHDGDPEDVEEGYTVLVRTEKTYTGADGKEKTRRGRRQDHRTRRLGQIFLRGAAVVMVCGEDAAVTMRP